MKTFEIIDEPGVVTAPTLERQNQGAQVKVTYSVSLRAA